MTELPPTPPTSPSSTAPTLEGVTELPAVVIDDRPCVKCAYNLCGLPGSGSCPECGTPVERSLRGDLLRYASPEYVAQLHRGVFLVQTGIIVMVLMVVLSIAIGIVGIVSGAGLIMHVAALGQASLSVYGWWLLSAADPGQLSTNRGERPRRLIRIAVIANASITLAGFAIDLLGGVGAIPAGTSGAKSIHVISIVMEIVSIGATLVQFFASMLYIAWIGPRLPSLRVVKRARTMLWLGPVLYTVGLLLLGLGPLIALVLYYNLLEWVRKDIRAIRAGKQSVTGVEY